MKRKSKSNFQAIQPKNLVLSFKFANVQADCNPGIYDKDQCDRIQAIVNYAAKDVTIDYTFVQFEGTKYEKTFIAEEGWKQLCEVLNQTENGMLCDNEEHQLLRETYSLIIIQYIYQFLEDFGYDIADICLEMPKDSKFIVEIESQNFSDNYQGKWQYWQ